MSPSWEDDALNVQSLNPPNRRNYSATATSNETTAADENRPGLNRAQQSYYHSLLEINDEIDVYIQQESSQHGFCQMIRSEKTWSRILVECFFSKFSWYNPHLKNPDGPKLEKAWAYYEHFTLARHFTDESTSADHKLERAEPGEFKSTKLYHPFTTPESSLNEFGLGVALYFTTLRIVGVILLLTGFINVVNIMFFASSEYGDHTSIDSQASSVPLTLMGSAICTDREWVVCQGCNETEWNTDTSTRKLFGTGEHPITGETLDFVQRIACGRPGLQEGLINYGSLWFLIISLGVLSFYQRKREEIFDEQKQTATDYSIMVKNPPPDAYDPEVWRTFFSQFAEKQVTGVTVALDNGLLCRKLLYRRILRNIARNTFQRGIDLDDEDSMRVEAARLEAIIEGERNFCSCLWDCALAPILRCFNIGIPPEVLVDKIFQLTEEIQELLKGKYNVTKVFVTFETEAGQRTALEALDNSQMIIKLQQTERVPPSTLFQGKVLDVVEPDEPSSIRWMEIEVPLRRRMIQRMITLLITCGVVVGCGFLVFLARERLGAGFSGPLTTIFNSSVPIIIKLLLLIESHGSEGSRQQSLYLKITIFRWFNTAILTRIITSFKATLGNGNSDVLRTINSIMLSELFLSPFLRALDIVGNFKKHYLGPRSRTQVQMNLWFQGTVYNLGERYTDFTKVLFLCFFYSALFPSIFFFSGIILLVQYVVDKFCLMRIWRFSPAVGPELAIFSRRYFFSTALVIMAITASFDWVHFPFDNICDATDPQNFDFAGNYSIVDLAETPVDIVVSQSENAVYCDQSYRGFDGFPFPATSRLQDGRIDWMTPDQIRVTNIYGWSTVGILAAFVTIIFGSQIANLLLGLFRPTYKPSGKDAKIDFHNVTEISLYVPQFSIGDFEFPVLLCDVDELNTEWIGWTDKDDPKYDNHNIIFDVPYDGMKRHKHEKKQEEEDEQAIEEGNRDDDGEGVEVSDVPLDDCKEGEERCSRPVFSIVKSWQRQG